MKPAFSELAPFLWSYFRRYLGWLALALTATAVYAVTTVLLLALFRPILSDVLLTDAGTAGGLVEVAAAEPAADAGAAGFGLDLDDLFADFLDRIEAAVGVNPKNAVWFLPLLFIFVFLMRSFAGFVNGYLFQIIGLGATNDLRNDLYRRILHQSSRFYARHPTGELVSRVGNDVSVMQNAVSSRMLDLIQQSVTLVFLVWYLMSTHLKLAAICLVVAPAVLIPIVRFGKGMRRTTHRTQERLAEVSNLVAEAARGQRVVKAFAMEGFELERFEKATAKHLKAKLRAQLLSYLSSPVVESMAAIGGAAFVIYAGLIVRRGEMEPAVVVSFLTNLLMLYDPIRKLNKVNLILQEALAAAQRVAGMMAIPNDVEDAPGAPELAPLHRGIEFRDIWFSYEDAEVLKGVDFAVERGQVVAVVGLSGAGKSTLVNLLPRFFDPIRGQVLVDGVDIREVTLKSLRSQIGLVTQDTILFDDTVRNNIAYGSAEMPLQTVQAAAQAAYADEFIAEIAEGYDAMIGEGGLKLSGGQRQRLAIARALVKDPPILILDEATSHLDSESEALVQKALYNLMSGRTALVIAHRLSTVQRADRILVMEDGRIVEDGTHLELLAAAGVYKRLFDLQFPDVEPDADPVTPASATGGTPRQQEGED